jgi:hypothetical protein
VAADVLISTADFMFRREGRDRGTPGSRCDVPRLGIAKIAAEGCLPNVDEIRDF